MLRGYTKERGAIVQAGALMTVDWPGGSPLSGASNKITYRSNMIVYDSLRFMCRGVCASSRGALNVSVWLHSGDGEHS